jgi:hypothetical protein
VEEQQDASNGVLQSMDIPPDTQVDFEFVASSTRIVKELPIMANKLSIWCRSTGNESLEKLAGAYGRYASTLERYFHQCKRFDNLTVEECFVEMALDKLRS